MSLRFLLPISVFCCFSLISYGQGQLVARGHRATPQVQAKPTTLYTLPQFYGKWQETKRVGPTKKAVAFLDTTLLQFNEDRTVEAKKTTDDKMALRMIEKASIDDENVLMSADQDYTAQSVTKDQIVLLDQDDTTHYFKKVKVFAYETVAGYVPARDPSVPKPDVTVAIGNIMGNWTVYKREAKPGYITSTTIVLKYLNITKKIDANNASGTATIYSGETSQEVPCTILIHGKNIKIATANIIYDLPVKVADGKELDFGTTDMMYYCKQL